jgi:hypothetical protein
VVAVSTGGVAERPHLERHPVRGERFVWELEHALCAREQRHGPRGAGVGSPAERLGEPAVQPLRLPRADDLPHDPRR